ncbi:rhomboid family intramembrane serine protease [Bacteroidota bacterium]
MSRYSPGSFQILPPVVKNLLIINVIFFVAKIIAARFSIDLDDILGLHYFGSEKFKPFQLITYMFMHGNFTHILFNMFALWMFGYAIENFMGPKRFFIYYMVTGVGAALLHYGIYYLEMRPLMSLFDAYFANPGDMGIQAQLGNALSPYFQHGFDISNINYQDVIDAKTAILNAPVVVGASGAVFGILLAFGMMFPNSVIYLYFAIPVKAKYFVIVYGLLEIYFGISGGGQSNVAHFAHVGGMIFGFILLKYWRIKRLN